MKQKTIFYCTDCGNETSKWAGRCTACGAWNTIVEAPEVKVSKAPVKGGSLRRSRPSRISELSTEYEVRFCSRVCDFSRRRTRDRKIYFAAANLRFDWRTGKDSICHWRGKSAPAQNAGAAARRRCGGRLCSCGD